MNWPHILFSSVSNIVLTFGCLFFILSVMLMSVFLESKTHSHTSFTIQIYDHTPVVVFRPCPIMNLVCKLQLEILDILQCRNFWQVKALYYVLIFLQTKARCHQRQRLELLQPQL